MWYMHTFCFMCKQKHKGRGETGERSAYSFALLMCFTFVWLSAQLIHGRGTSVGQSTGTNSGLVTALCLLAML